MKDKNKKSGYSKSERKTERNGRKSDNKPLYAIGAAFVMAYLGVGAALLVKNHGAGQGFIAFTRKMVPAVSTSSDPVARAVERDGQSYQLYMDRKFKESLDILTESIAVYQQAMAAAQARSDDYTVRRMETLVAENYQHVGKCYVQIAQDALGSNEPAKARDAFVAADAAYAQSMPFYQKYGNYAGCSMGEALQGYAKVLSFLGKDKELTEVKDLAARNKITIE